MAITRTEKEFKEFHAAMKEVEVTMPGNQAWLRFTDEGSEGQWRDRWTGEVQNFNSIPWRLESEPTGFTRENCSGLTNEGDFFWAFDVDCYYAGLASVCQDINLFFRFV